MANTGECWRNEGDLARALADLEKASERMYGLLAAATGDATLVREQAAIVRLQGEIRLLRGDRPQALERFQQVRLRLEDVWRDQPADRRLIRDLSISYERLAELSDPVRARPFLEMASQLMTDALLRDPRDPEYRLLLGRQCRQHGQILARLGLYRAARFETDRAFSFARENLQVYPTVPEYLQATAAANWQQAVLISAFEPQAFVPALAQSAARLRYQLHTQTMEVAQFQLDWLEQCLASAELLLQHQHWSEADVLFQTARTSIERTIELVRSDSVSEARLQSARWQVVASPAFAGYRQRMYLGLAVTRERRFRRRWIERRCGRGGIAGCGKVAGCRAALEDRTHAEQDRRLERFPHADPAAGPRRGTGSARRGTQRSRGAASIAECGRRDSRRSCSGRAATRSRS